MALRRGRSFARRGAPPQHRLLGRG